MSERGPGRQRSFRGPRRMRRARDSTLPQGVFRCIVVLDAPRSTERFVFLHPDPRRLRRDLLPPGGSASALPAVRSPQALRLRRSGLHPLLAQLPRQEVAQYRFFAWRSWPPSSTSSRPSAIISSTSTTPFSGGSRAAATSSRPSTTGTGRSPGPTRRSSPLAASSPPSSSIPP